MISNKTQRHDEGSAIVELSIALPILLLIMAATIDFSRVFHTAMALNDAARAGAQYGAASSASSNDTTGMINTAVAATNISLTSPDVQASRFCNCATNAGAFSDTVGAGGANDCLGPEATACPSGHRVITVTVTTTKVFSTIFTGILPGALRTTTLTRYSTLRVPQ